MKFTTLVPVNFNDGTKVPQSQIDAILARFWVLFGGCTVEGPVVGHWVNDNGTHFQDDCLKVWVVADNSRLEDAETLVRQIGAQLHQEAMYFEVEHHPESGVRILDTK